MPLPQPGAQRLLQVAEQLGPELRWLESAVVLEPTPLDRIQSSSNFLQRQIGLTTQIDPPDPVPHAVQRLRTYHRKEARQDLSMTALGHAWPEAIAEKRELDLRKLPTTATILAIDHLGLLRM